MSDAPTTVYDVVIVGAGPVGSAAAVLADRHGLRTLLVDASTEVYPLPRAIHFDADIMRIFQHAGVTDELEPLTRATSGGLHLGADGLPIRDFRVTAAVGDLGWKPHYMFYQPELDALLRRRAEDSALVTTLFGWRCESATDDGDGVTVTLTQEGAAPRQLRGRYLIAADGASSPLRKQLGITLTDDGFEEPWVIIDGHVDDEELGPDYSIMYCDPSRPGTYIPGPGSHRRWEFMLLPGEDGSAFTTTDGAWPLIGRVTPWLERQQIAIERTAVYRFHALVADRWRVGRLFLAGDAAHQTPPFYGQGMCHGIRDVRNLLWKLAAVVAGTDDEAVLDTYQVERQPHVRAIIDQSVANGRYICVLDPAEAAARDEQMRRRAAGPQQVQARTFRDLIPGLVTGLLDPERSAGAGLLFPQPRVLDAHGAPVRLDELLGSGWVLLQQQGAPVAAADDGVAVLLVGRDLTDPSGLLAEWFATFGCTSALVRPDRYVFGTASAADVTELLERASTAREPMADALRA